MTGNGNPLLFLPLGGAGEIGMNLNLYGYGGKWLMVDLGISFADERLPGVDIIMPDPGFIVERRDDLLGLVLTHAHEDHLGAVPYLWPRLRCPVYATPFSAAVLRRKLNRDGAAPGINDLDLTEIPLSSKFTLGTFDIELISLTHSIPEPNALAIRTPLGTVLHTGDWKIDPDPVVGGTTDEEALRRYGEEGILAIVCDSTNVFQPGVSGSEGEVRKNLIEIVGKFDRCVAVSGFASNVARIDTVAAAAEANGRQVAVAGRSLWRIIEAARETGYIDSDRKFLNDREAIALPRDQVLYLCTGSQGEPNAALARIASDSHPHISLERGDAVIFSSKIIPGNETAINRLHNLFVYKGVEVVTEDDHFVHVSGHPCRDELARMYQWIRPQIAVPVHGEARHLIEHARLAGELQVPQPVVVENGDLLRLAPGSPEIVDQVPFGRLMADGNAVVNVASPVLQMRRRLMHNGAAFVSVVVDAKGRLSAEPQITAQGLFHDNEPGNNRECALARAVEAVRVAFSGLSERDRKDDKKAREAVRLSVLRSLKGSRGKRPFVEVQIVRLRAGVS